MAKLQHYLVISFLISLFSSVNVQASVLDEHVIEVRGQGTVNVQPDNFSLRLSVIQTGRITSKLRTLVDHKSNQVIAIAESLGIPSHDIDSARVNLRVIKEPSSVHVQGVEVNKTFPQQKRGKVYVGVDSTENNSDKSQIFELSRTITINFSKIEDYDTFVSKVIKVGVERISPLAMSIENSERSYREALAKAINNANEKAYQIAKQANITLDKLVYLKELSSNHYQPRLAVANMYRDSSVEHHSQVAETAISASVLVKFAIKE